MDKIDQQKHITIARIMKNYQQQELADEMNAELPAEIRVTQVMLSKLEQGWKKTIAEPIAKVLCKKLNITMEELTKGGLRVRG